MCYLTFFNSSESKSECVASESVLKSLERRGAPVTFEDVVVVFHDNRQVCQVCVWYTTLSNITLDTLALRHRSSHFMTGSLNRQVQRSMV